MEKVVYITDGKQMPDLSVQQLTELSDRISKECGKHLAGQHPGAVGATLGELVAKYLAGFVVPGNAEKTDQYREYLIEQHISLVRQLLPHEESNEAKAWKQPHGRS